MWDGGDLRAMLYKSFRDRKRKCLFTGYNPLPHFYPSCENPPRPKGSVCILPVSLKARSTFEQLHKSSSQGTHTGLTMITLYGEINFSVISSRNVSRFVLRNICVCVFYIFFLKSQAKLDEG